MILRKRTLKQIESLVPLVPRQMVTRRSAAAATMKRFLGIAILCLVASTVRAERLSIIGVRAPDINCKFDTDCTVTVSDSSDTLVDLSPDYSPRGENNL